MAPSLCFNGMTADAGGHAFAADLVQDKNPGGNRSVTTCHQIRTGGPVSLIAD